MDAVAAAYAAAEAAGALVGEVEWPVPSDLPVAAAVGAGSGSGRKLLILDMNNFLVDRDGGHSQPDVARPPPPRPPDARIGRWDIYERPSVRDFLRWALDRFDLALWSSAKKHNLLPLAAHIFGPDLPRLAFVWHQEHCTLDGRSGPRAKPVLLKELRKVWARFTGRYGPHNTLLIDDSPYKAVRNPAHTSIHPPPFAVFEPSAGGEAVESALAEGGYLREYLARLACAEEDVPGFLQKWPFTTPALLLERNPEEIELMDPPLEEEEEEEEGEKRGQMEAEEEEEGPAAPEAEAGGSGRALLLDAVAGVAPVSGPVTCGSKRKGQSPADEKAAPKPSKKAAREERLSKKKASRGARQQATVVGTDASEEPTYPRYHPTAGGPSPALALLTALGGRGLPAPLLVSFAAATGPGYSACCVLPHLAVEVSTAADPAPAASRFAAEQQAALLALAYIEGRRTPAGSLTLERPPGIPAPAASAEMVAAALERPDGQPSSELMAYVADQLTAAEAELRRQQTRVACLREAVAAGPVGGAVMRAGVMEALAPSAGAVTGAANGGVGLLPLARAGDAISTLKQLAEKQKWPQPNYTTSRSDLGGVATFSITVALPASGAPPATAPPQISAKAAKAIAAALMLAQIEHAVAKNAGARAGISSVGVAACT